MPSLWKPENWSERLAELEARVGDLKEVPLRRDVRSLGMLLGEVLREQAGDELFEKVEALRQSAIRRREAQADGSLVEADKLLQLAVLDVNSMPVDTATMWKRLRGMRLRRWSWCTHCLPSGRFG
jgi:phosphoenolpyruvate carboxylase